MDIVSARTRELLTLAALAFIAPACWARPLLVPPKHLELPLPAGAQSPGPFDPDSARPAIDGDTVLVAANRAINANNDRVDGVYIFQRDDQWQLELCGPARRRPKLALRCSTATSPRSTFPGVCRCTNGARRAGR